MRYLGCALALALLAAACGSSETGLDQPVASELENDVSAGSAAGNTVDEPAQGAAPSGPYELTPATMPAISPGGLATGSIVIHGTTIEYVTVTPAGFRLGDQVPVLLAMPPGGQDIGITQRVTAGTYEQQALARGWVVISPAAPGDLYFQGAEDLIPEMLRWIGAWVTPSGGRPHLAGISNGGISAFRIAATNPDKFASMVVFPGFPRSDEDRVALRDIASIPVRLYVGEFDTGWIAAMEEATEELRGFGGDAQLEIVAGEQHVIQSLQDGRAVFDDLEAAR